MEGWQRVNRAKSKTQAGVASKEAIVIPIEGSQEISKIKEINDVRNETNDDEEKSSNEVSKEPEVALSDQQGKDQDEGTTTTKEGESMENSEEDTESEEEEEEEGEIELTTPRKTKTKGRKSKKRSQGTGDL